MVRRNIIFLLLFCALLGGVLLEQNYIDSTLFEMEEQIEGLQSDIKDENLSNSSKDIASIKSYWHDKEIVFSLFVDYKDIDQIGKQIELIDEHLTNVDFELAAVECGLLLHIVKTYHSTVSFDWQNII